MQNIHERLTGLWSETGASSRRTERFAVSISASLTVGLTTSVDMGKRIFLKNHGFSARCPAFFFQNFYMSDSKFPISLWGRSSPPSYSVDTSQLIHFARVCSNVDDLNNRNLFLTVKLLKHGYRYHKFEKHF